MQEVTTSTRQRVVRPRTLTLSSPVSALPVESVRAINVFARLRTAKDQVPTISELIDH